MSGFVWLAFVVGMIIYSQAQAKKMKEKQRAKTAFERLDELVEEAARNTHHSKAKPTPKPQTPIRTANRKAGSSIRKQQPQEETRRQIAERKQELKRKRAQQTASVEPTTPHAVTPEVAPEAAVTPTSGEAIRNEFDLRRAVIYSEILKPRYEVYE